MNPFRAPENAHLPGPHLSWVNWGSVNFACILRWGSRTCIITLGENDWRRRAVTHLSGGREHYLLISQAGHWQGASSSDLWWPPWFPTISTSQVFFLSSPHCKAAVIRAIRSTSQDHGPPGEGDFECCACLIRWAAPARLLLRPDSLEGWWITNFPRQGEAIDYTAPKSDKMGMRQSFINIRTKRSWELHSIRLEIKKCQAAKSRKGRCRLMAGRWSYCFFCRCR